MISGVVFTALRGLVNDRCYPNEFPQELINPPKSSTGGSNPNYPTWPAIRYYQLSALNAPCILGTGDEDTDDTTIQIDIVARTYGAMRSLVTQVIAALQDTDPPCTRDFVFEDYDEETKTHRGILRYTFYASSPAVGSPTGSP